MEGLDGCGKTVVGRLFAAMIGAEYVTLPPAELRLASPELLCDFRSEVRYLYYLSGVACIAAKGARGSLLVADRYLASAHALHVLVPVEYQSFLRVIPLAPADVTFFLDVDESTRGERLRSRGTDLDPFEYQLGADEEFRDLVVRQMRSYPSTFVIDAAGHPPSEVALLAMGIWRDMNLASS
jgi:thymidylate kinase